MTAATEIFDELASESESSMAHEATAEPVAPAPAAEPEPLPTTPAAESVAPAPAAEPESSPAAVPASSEELSRRQLQQQWLEAVLRELRCLPEEDECLAPIYQLLRSWATPQCLEEMPPGLVYEWLTQFFNDW